MELNLAIQLAIFTGIFTVISGAVILFARRWYLYWRQVFLIAAMEKQRSDGGKSTYDDRPEIALSGAAYLLTAFAICYALALLFYKSILNTAAIFFSFVYSLGLRILVSGT